MDTDHSRLYLAMVEKFLDPADIVAPFSGCIADKWLLWVCAVVRRCFPVGASPTRRPLQPEATGAVMEVTRWLKPLGSVSRIGDSARVQAAT